MPNKGISPGRRFIKTFLITVVLIIIIAYGFQVTKINLEEPKEERRQQQLINVLRTLAHPDLVEYDTERVNVEAAILVPCPAAEFTLPDLNRPGPTIKLSPQCAASGSKIEVTGGGFEPGEELFLYFVPYVANSSQEVELPLTNQKIKADIQGGFSTTVELRRGRASEEPQKVRVVVNRQSGLPRPSQTVNETVAKIIETIFLALIATALGTILSIPVSFLSARNLMVQVTSTFGSLITFLVVGPLGWVAGMWLFKTLGQQAAGLLSGNLTAGLIVTGPILLFLTVRASTSSTPWSSKLRSYGLGLLGITLAALGLGLIGSLGLIAGQAVASVLGPFAFLGNFIFVVADALIVFLPLVGGVVGAFAFISVVGPISEELLRQTGKTILGKVYTIVMAILAGAILFGLLVGFIAWLYELENTWLVIGLAMAGGAALLGITAGALEPDRAMPSGMIMYYVGRTILNVLRAIEPLIMAIVFVVWVGIGPFAGVLALTLHTIASLGKLYSEQVENISEGPLEAVTATGANRLQTIIYAVIPQIVPPYIAFTIYRWDINVRMSTIIGFAGGGGIGFLLQQNLNLLKYRQASVQMIAIAIVVATLDYVSARIREKIV